jgi:hypothetical protein
MGKVLKLDIAGNPLSWITYDRAAYFMAKGKVGWTPYAQETILRGGINAATLKQSTFNMPSIMAIKGKGVGKHHLSRPKLKNDYLYRRDGHICCYCGEKFSENNLTMDHVVPQSRDGSTTWENLVSACFPCNNAKGNRTPEEAKMPMLYKPFLPTHAEYLFFRESDKTECQVQYLQSFMRKIKYDS